MPSTLQEKVDQRAKLVADARKHIEDCEQRNQMSADEQGVFDKMLADAKILEDEIEQENQAAKALADRQAALNQAEDQLVQSVNPQAAQQLQRSLGQQQVPGGGSQLSQADALTKMVAEFGRGGTIGVKQMDDYQSIMQTSKCRWDTKDGGLYIPISAEAPTCIHKFEQAQSIGTNTAGGHTTMPGFVASLERALLEFGGMRSVSRIIRTSTGSALDMPTANDTSNTGVILSENVQDAEQDVTFGNLTLDAYKYSSRIVRVSVELMQDSELNIGAIIGSMLGERLGRVMNTHATTGTGSSQPNGIVTASTLGKTAAATTAITFDELKDLKTSVDPAYRPGATWMFNDAVRNYIAKLKDGDSNYLWQPRVISTEPDLLCGDPTVINQDMSSTITASDKTVLYGQMMKYIMREVRGVTLIRLSERYADYHQVGFVAIMRFDSDLLDAGTNPVKYLQQAAS